MSRTEAKRRFSRQDLERQTAGVECRKDGGVIDEIPGAYKDIDEVIVGHTNEPEYKKLQSNELMEAFRDRTIKIDIPYNIRLDDEIAIYNRVLTDAEILAHYRLAAG